MISKKTWQYFYASTFLMLFAGVSGLCEIIIPRLHYDLRVEVRRGNDHYEKLIKDLRSSDEQISSKKVAEAIHRARIQGNINYDRTVSQQDTIIEITCVALFAALVQVLLIRDLRIKFERMTESHPTQTSDPLVR